MPASIPVLPGGEGRPVHGRVGVCPLPVPGCARLPRYCGAKAHGSGVWSQAAPPALGAHAGGAPHPAASPLVVLRVEGDVTAVVGGGARARPGARLGAGGQGVTAVAGATSAVVVLAVVYGGTDVHAEASLRLLLDLGSGK